MRIKMNKKRILVALSMVGVISVAHGQWAVTNVDDPLYFGPTGIFTQLMGQMLNSVKTSVDSNNAAQQVGIQQAAQFQNDTDTRNRLAATQAAMAAKDLAQIPTLERCVQLSKKGIGSSAISSSLASASRGGGGTTVKTPGDMATTITSDVTKAALPIQSKVTNQTCTPTQIAANIGGCSAGASNYAGGDMSSYSIKRNINKADTPSGSDFANYTLNDDGWKVAQAYIANSTLSQAPKVLPTAQLKQNPVYESMYDGIMNNLIAAQNALTDIAGIRRQGALQPGSVAGTSWANAASQWTALFGTALKQPTPPSLYDTINFQVYQDYLGTPSDTTQGDEAKTLQAIDGKMALNNFIAWKQLNQAENTNILLAQILVQLTTPTNINQVNSEYQRIIQSKAN